MRALTEDELKRIGTWALVLVIAIVGGSLVLALSPFKDLFKRETTVATGDVVLKTLRERKDFVAATGTYEVPVVVCNGTPKGYVLKDGRDKDGNTPAQQLIAACGGFLDAKATVLASAEVDAVIDLSELKSDDISVAGKQVTVKLPGVTLAEPRVDAEDGISVIGKDGSVPLIGGKLPDDYQARAAGAAKTAVTRVAGESDLPDLGRRSVRSLFEGLLSALGFTDVEVVVKSSPADSR